MTQFDTENKDVLLATAIASGATASAAARELDLSRSAVQRRLADPDFRRLVSDLRREVVTAALGRITDNLTRAADTMAALLDAEQPHIRLRAARVLVTLGLKLQDSVELADRVEEVERELARKQGVNP
jgi:hypothetical protein